MTDSGAALANEALRLADAGRMHEALALVDRAIAAAPNNANYRYDRGCLLYSLGRGEDAIDAFEAAIALNPDFGDAHYNRALLLQHQGRMIEAAEGYQAAFTAKPTLAQAWNNHAGVLRAIGDFPNALISIERAIALRPGNAGAHYNRGAVLMALQRFDDAIAALQQALRLAPEHGGAQALLASCLLRVCRWTPLAPLAEHLIAKVKAGSSDVAPLALLWLSDDPLLQRKCAAANTAFVVGPNPPTRLWQGEAYTHQPLRIAYISTDFVEHPVGAQIVGVLEAHDRDAFEVHGVFVGPNDGSALSQRIAAACDHFHQVQRLGDEELAAMLREREIDLIVDLNGQTEGNRLRMLQHHPAPVQATFLGYAGTTGADFIDYILLDRVIAPFADQANFSEQIVQLPNSFWPFDSAIAPSAPPTRASVGLPENAIVFCAFNATRKFNPEMFAAWMRILAAVPDSILWLRKDRDSVMDTLRGEARSHGIDPARLHWAGRIDDRADYLARHACADLFLDTFPYGAHVTASDALWSGLPVLTRRGAGFASRVASSFLATLGLDDLVTSSLAEYEALAIALGNDRARLGALRERLIAARATSPLFQTARFVRDLERAYTHMIENARRGQSPRAFAVAPP
jgi:predicted O-linked N-acetylglucosamine transferase (SPINDLY family)